MIMVGSSDTVETLDKASRELGSLLSDSETEIATVASDFGQLAGLTDAIFNFAAGVIGSIEEKSVSSILPNLQVLGTVATGFIQDRMQETAQVLDIVKTEADLLARLSKLTQGQHSIARETHTLCVLTKIEVARLGQLGSGFEYLAHQLDDFSQSVAKSTADLASHTEERRVAVSETIHALAVELPRMQEEFTRIAGELANALTEADSTLGHLFQAPVQLRSCTAELSGQISGVVAAIQFHDITRQQIEHIQEAVLLISAKVGEEDQHDLDTVNRPSWIAGGLVIQVYQLRCVQETVGAWVSQIRTCMDSILKISSADLKGIGPMVLEQERQLSRQLGRIERLEQECAADSERIEEALAGLSSLTQLVGEHLQRSRTIRESLQLLTFNSIIEASRLGTQADAILEISQSIKRISAAWNEVTDRSAQANEDILTLLQQARERMSTGGSDKLKEAQLGTMANLEGLRTAATYTAGEAAEIENSIEKLHAKLTFVGAAGERLDACFARIGTVLQEFESLKRDYERSSPSPLSINDRRSVEAVFSASYTTEIEREVLRAALAGAPLPVVHQNLTGNDVELF
jgi:methyl-accepting chemotaxis protein